MLVTCAIPLGFGYLVILLETERRSDGRSGPSWWDLTKGIESTYRLRVLWLLGAGVVATLAGFRLILRFRFKRRLLGVVSGPIPVMAGARYSLSRERFMDSAAQDAAASRSTNPIPLEWSCPVSVDT